MDIELGSVFRFGVWTVRKQSALDPTHSENANDTT